MNLKIGENYSIKHDRKGEFVIKLLSHNDEWITGEILLGEAKAIMNYNIKLKGEEITMRKSFLKITEIQNN